MIPAAPAFLDLDTGRITGEVQPATRESDTPIATPPPTRPAELDPEPIHRTARQPNHARGGVADRGDRQQTPTLGEQREHTRDDRRRR